MSAAIAAHRTWWRTCVFIALFLIAGPISMAQAFDGIERTTGDAPQWAVIWLHGLGADAHDFDPIVPELVRPHWPAVRFVFPNAPVRPVTINNGLRMRAWYDILGLEIAQQQDEAGIATSIEIVHGLIEREIARGIPSERILLAGFSQGGAIVLAAGIRSKKSLGGIIALSTYLPLAQYTDAERTSANKAVPIFMAHGTQDPVVGIALGQMSRDYLANFGYTIEWHEYPMPHSVSPQEIADLGAWLERRFAAAPR